jgi:hypothetical protein
MRIEMTNKFYNVAQKGSRTQNKKHEKLRDFKEGRFKCSRQRQINNNKISKKIKKK